MLKFKNWRKKERFSDIHMLPGDTLQLTYTDEKKRTHILTEENIGRHMTVNEARTFDAEVDGRDAIGGVFIEKEKKEHGIFGREVIEPTVENWDKVCLAIVVAVILIIGAAVIFN